MNKRPDRVSDGKSDKQNGGHPPPSLLYLLAFFMLRLGPWASTRTSPHD